MEVEFGPHLSLTIGLCRTKDYHLSMIPFSPYFVVLAVIGLAVRGVMIGVLTGWLVSSVTKCGNQGLAKDAVLGSIGYMAGFAVAIFMPWPRNTVTEQLPGGGSVATTMNSYQHPERVALVLAVLLPLLLELYRFQKARKNRPEVSLPQA